MIERRAVLLAGLTLSLLMVGASVGYLISDNSSNGEMDVSEQIFDPFFKKRRMTTETLASTFYLRRI